MRILLLLAIAACSTQQKKPIPPTVVTLPPVIVEEPVVVKTTDHGSSGYQQGIKFVPTGKMTDFQRDMITKAAAKTNEVIQSQCFVDWMSKQKTMNSTNGRTKEQVIDHIRAATNEIAVKTYFSKWGSCIGCTSAVAFRQPPRSEINLNTSFFTSARSVCRWAATLLHESLHCLGYLHSREWSRFREDTVPYLGSGRKSKYGGDVFSECCR